MKYQSWKDCDRYYSKAIQVAARYSIALEEFVPHLAPQYHYTTTQIKYMRAQCRAAMNSHEDIMESRAQRDSNVTWNGPPLIVPPSDLPDLENEIKRQKAERS